MQVVLTLRAFSMTDLNFWAFNGQTKVRVFHVPMDTPKLCKRSVRL